MAELIPIATTLRNPITRPYEILKDVPQFRLYPSGGKTILVGDMENGPEAKPL
jgi:hypothetical protein